MSGQARRSYRAAEWTAGGFQVSEFPLVPPGRGEVQVRVSACSVCLTEVHFTDGYYDELAAPARLGHEFCGVVEAAGPEVDGLAEGSLVAGFDSFGGFGEIVTGAAGLFVPLPIDLPPERGCLLEPVSCCVYAVRRAGAPSGATVLVTGAGSNGLLIAQLARQAGAGRVIVSEPDASRREQALALGADEVVDPAAAPLAEALRGRVITLGFESAGSPAALRDLLDVVADDGRVVMFGVHRDTAVLQLPLYGFHFRNLSLIGSFGADRQAAARAAELLPELELDALISHTFGLDEIARAFAAARSASGLKVIVYPGRPA
jgi:2-desacetyl-2-hydroxyethyl bacteriochlorophyllide A dehydrogenase